MALPFYSHLINFHTSTPGMVLNIPSPEESDGRIFLPRLTRMSLLFAVLVLVVSFFVQSIYLTLGVVIVGTILTFIHTAVLLKYKYAQ